MGHFVLFLLYSLLTSAGVVLIVLICAVLIAWIVFLVSGVFLSVRAWREIRRRENNRCA